MFSRNPAPCLAGLLTILLTMAGMNSRVCGFSADSSRPNVILVVTDDQGYGDLGCLGNREIRTPHLDQLYAESIRLTNFHVDPTCAPSRAALMTGRYSSRTGVWHTILGRSIMRNDEVTLAEVFAANGYRTGIFGKWHLGDNAPSRPEDQGFHEGVTHGGGGVGQTPDFWGNDYFDDTYRRWAATADTPSQSRFEKFPGYCTDVFFREAQAFVERNRRQPFFLYLSTNAAHGPYRAPESDIQPYRDRGIPSPRAEFYGMITRIDQNMARLRSRLAELELAENTLLIFMTDNGTAAGFDRQGGFNAGMRGIKASEYDGGHRVPCFIHWPAGGMNAGQNRDLLCGHVDLLPTLVELCRLQPVPTQPLDGCSLAAVLRGQSAEAPKPARTLIVHSQRIEHPQKWRKCSVMRGNWRLINGKELYDLAHDPGQQTDLAATRPALVAELRKAYEQWWDSISTRFDEYVPIDLGNPAAPTATLTGHDWHTTSRDCPWNQAIIARGNFGNGFWAVQVVRDGQYEITLRQRPADVPFSLNAESARLQIGTVDARKPVSQEASSVTFVIDLKAGPARLQTWLEGPGGKTQGAPFVEVRYLGPS
jgi:arylsulfatase A-like enzyme